MSSIDDYLAGFGEEPGYLDYGRIGPLSEAVRSEMMLQAEVLGRARHGSLEPLLDAGERFHEAVSVMTGFPAANIVTQPNTSTGLMHVMFGLTGGILLSPHEFPSLTFAVQRAAENMHVLEPTWLETDGGRVTPARIREQLTDQTVAVAVSLVDSRTGYLSDIEGIRQVIGDDRLLIVDAIQGFGVVDAPYEVADVVTTGGQKWMRAGWGTGFLALSDRAIHELVPVFSGWTGIEEDDPTAGGWDAVSEPASAARAFQTTNADKVAESRFAAALEDLAAVGVPQVSALVAERTAQVIDLADEFGVAVASSRAEHERAGIVVLDLEDDQLNPLTASLHNHGLTATVRQGSVRISCHAGTTDETLTMLRDAFVSFGTAVTY